MLTKEETIMRKLLVLLMILIIMGAVWSLPLYLVVNLVLWLFHIPFHLTWLQAFGVCMLASIIKGLLSKGD
jgi:hypothetical protein